MIDTAEFQRLRRIRQLGLAHFTYQGAEHSRFTHSLGAMFLATRVVFKLSNTYDISDEERIAVRAAALLHDIGHGALSHAFEPILNFHHEDYTIRAILSPETEVGRVLREFSSELPTMIAEIISGKFRPFALAQLVSSQLDVDRMDYLLRDSLMTGAKYGVFDLEWIIRSLEIDQANDRLYVSAHGLYAVEDYLQARYYMFRQVYFHRSHHAAEAVIRSLIVRAMLLAKTGGDVWFVPGSPFEKVLRGEPLELAEHLALDDSDVLFHIKRWQTSSDPILADLSKRFLNRRLFKALDLDMPEDERDLFLEKARALTRERGYDPEYYFLESHAEEVPYYFYTKETSEPQKLIYVEDGFSRPNIREISEISAAVRGLQRGFRIHRVCFPPEIKDQILSLYRPAQSSNAS